jgi:hypothetical protein
MCQKRYSQKFSQGVFNTLAQSETNYYDKPAIIVNGNGSDLNNSKALKGKAKRKMITQKMVLNLIDVVDKNGADKRKKSYWNTYHCQNRIFTANGKLYGKYCKNRFCTLCCAIRKAELINKYLPVIKEWEQPYFVTLTVKAYELKYLRKLILKVMAAFNRITTKYRKRHQRGKGIKLVGIKSLECNFNPIKKTYNPHLHLIVANKEMADTLIKEWLQIWTRKYTIGIAQDSKPINDREKALIEIIKYGSKIFTEPDLYKKLHSEHNIYAAALDNIFRSMQGLRIFERFGFDLPKENSRKETQATVIKSYGEWIFDPSYFDWINADSEQRLSNYEPLAQLIELLNNRIDTDLE